MRRIFSREMISRRPRLPGREVLIAPIDVSSLLFSVSASSAISAVVISSNILR
jgi:hypothetical protein